MFFSVHKPIKIAGSPYIPCVCYENNRFIEPTINKLVAEGIATIYEKKVSFCDGKIIEEATVKAEVKESKKEKYTKGF